MKSSEGCGRAGAMAARIQVFSKAQHHHMPCEGDTYGLWRVCTAAAHLPHSSFLAAHGSSFCALHLHRHLPVDPPSPCHRRGLFAARCLRPSQASAGHYLLLSRFLHPVQLCDRGIQKCSAGLGKWSYSLGYGDSEKIAPMMETCGRLEGVCLGEQKALSRRSKADWRANTIRGAGVSASVPRHWRTLGEMIS